MRRHITYANVVATIALVGMLVGGTAFAVDKIGSNGIKRGAVTKPKIAKRAVGAKKLGQLEVVEGPVVRVPPDQSRYVEVECPRKALAISGGALLENANDAIHNAAIISSARTSRRRFWSVGVENTGGNSGGARSWRPQVLCLVK